MSQEFVINGNKPLGGEVFIEGSKNAAGPLLAASILAEDEVILDNIPLVSDILNLISILQGIGMEIQWLDDKKIKIRPGNDLDYERMDFRKAAKSRVSVLLIGALLHKFEKFKVAKPGGDRIGLRPISTHLNALRQLGVEVEEEGNFYIFKKSKLIGREIILPEFSVTATENLVMAATLAQGETIIKTAAEEPQVQDLCLFLNKMGADIQGVGTHTLRIKGVKHLKGATHRVIPDICDAGTFIIIGALMAERLLIRNVIPEHLDLFLEKLREIGVKFNKNKETIEVFKGENLKPTRLQALPYPGFPTDLLPLVVPLLTQVEGKSLIHDPLYDNRLNYAQELRRMGADIEIVDPHRAFIFGKTKLRGSNIKSWDIRAGASLVVAGLAAEGETVIENIEQIDRGYENIEERLRSIGADIIRREKDEN